MNVDSPSDTFYLHICVHWRTFSLFSPHLHGRTPTYPPRFGLDVTFFQTFFLRLTSYPSQPRRYILLYLSMAGRTSVTLGFYFIVSCLLVCLPDQSHAPWDRSLLLTHFASLESNTLWGKSRKFKTYYLIWSWLKFWHWDWSSVRWLPQFFLPLRFFEENSIWQPRISILNVIVRG